MLTIELQAQCITWMLDGICCMRGGPSICHETAWKTDIGITAIRHKVLDIRKNLGWPFTIGLLPEAEINAVSLSADNEIPAQKVPRCTALTME